MTYVMRSGAALAASLMALTMGCSDDQSAPSKHRTVPSVAIRGIPPTSAPPSVTPAIRMAVDIARRDVRVRRIVGDRRVTLYEASEAFGASERDTAVGAVVVLALDSPASIDEVVPSWICRDGRLRGIPVHLVATDVQLIEVWVDNEHRRVQGIDPGRWYPTEYEEVPGTVPFTEGPCPSD
jgi:hypothetical protein